jgi:hypothetical protein
MIFSFIFYRFNL